MSGFHRLEEVKALIIQTLTATLTASGFHRLGDSTGAGRSSLYEDTPVHGGLLAQLSSESRVYGGGLFAYLLRRSGAKALLRAVREAGGIHQEVDNPCPLVTHRTLTMIRMKNCMKNIPIVYLTCGNCM